MTNYFNFPLDAWQKYAREVCLSLDRPTKQTAQQFFYSFVQTPHLDIITTLMRQGSSLLLFALFSYIGKYPQPFVANGQSFAAIMEVLSSWQLHEFNLVRTSSDPFEPYVTKTIMMALGTLMKYLYENGDTSGDLTKYLQAMPLNFFKIFVLKTFVEVVEVVDVDMGYMRFRTMVYAFQEYVVPMICDTLMPFFLNFQEGLRINDLTSTLQSKLEVNEETREARAQEIQMSPQQEMESEYVLVLLKKIVEFNYNITYTEYESEQVIDTCLITFPERVSAKIINSQFLNALYFVVTKVLDSKIGPKKNHYLTLVLECLAKIMQARLGYVADQNKEKFVCTAVRGLYNFLKICQQLQSEALLEGILTCNKKLFLSVELNYIQQVLQKDPQAQSENLFQCYLRELTWMIEQIVRRTPIHCQNSILTQASEVVLKMVAHFGGKQGQAMEDSSQLLLQFLRRVVTSYVGNLSEGKCIFSSTRFIWLTQNKQAVSHLFDNFNKIGSFVFESFFRAVDFALDEYIGTKKDNLAILANILFLLSELVDHNFFERNTHMNRATNAELHILNSTIQKASMVVQDYSKNRLSFVNSPGASYLDVAILIFCQQLLIEYLSNFQSTPSLKIKHKLFLVNIFGPNFNEEADYEENQSEPTIVQYLSIVFQYINQQGLGSDCDAKLLHALQIVERVIFKLKWNMRRQTFLKSDIFRQLHAFFNSYSMSGSPMPQVIVKIGKITVSLNFDDILDQYKFRINKFIEKLPKKDGFGNVFYYLMGIFEGIQPSNILKYFWSRLNRHMNVPQFFKDMFQMAVQSSTDKYYKDICKMCKLVTLNKGLRSASNHYIAYQMFQFILPHLVWFIAELNKMGDQLDLDLVGDGVAQIIDMFNGIINGTHINIFVLDQCSQEEGQLGQKYVYEYVGLLSVLCRQVKLYPKLQEQVLSSFVFIGKQILQYIFSTDPKVSQIFTVLVVNMIDLLTEYVLVQLNGNRLIQDKLIKVMDGLRLVLRFVNRKVKITHNSTVSSNIKQYCQMVASYPSQNGPQCKIEKMVFFSLNLLLTNHKNNSTYLRCTSKFVFQINKAYSNLIMASFVKMDVSGDKLMEVQNILEKLREDAQQNFVQEFKSWVRMFEPYK